MSRTSGPAAVPREIAVLGGGLAGLSLAVQLVNHGVDARITVIEPRTAYRDDRTWCFWDVEDHPFRHLTAHRWPSWRVATDAGVRTVRGAGADYVRVPSGAVYADACARLAAASNVRVWSGVRVEEPVGRRVTTDAGVLDADLVFDGRPPVPPGPCDPPVLLQQFVGRRIRLPDARLDPSVCDLMDFRVAQDDGIAFLYLLPFDDREALAELTVLAPGVIAPERLDARLERALADRVGAGVEVLGEERGTIPMWPDLGTQRPEAPGVIPIGTRAGAPRPSTGYAFLPIQRHARALAARVAAGVPGPLAMRGAGTRWLDRVFLGRLQRVPEQAPELFARLFARVPADRLVRFLSERAGPVDHLAVMAALPTLPLLREAASVSLRRARLAGRQQRRGRARHDHRHASTRLPGPRGAW